MIMHEHFGLQHCTAFYIQWHLGYSKITRDCGLLLHFHHMQHFGCSIWRQVAINTPYFWLCFHNVDVMFSPKYFDLSCQVRDWTRVALQVIVDVQSTGTHCATLHHCLWEVDTSPLQCDAGLARPCYEDAEYPRSPQIVCFAAVATRTTLRCKFEAGRESRYMTFVGSGSS